MKLLLQLIGLLLGVFSSASPLSSAPNPTPPGFLLRTHWYQDGPFAEFTPGHQRVGCWSTAYAQILFFHRLQPFGRVRYECTGGEKVDLDLASLRFDWEQFPSDLSSTTPKTARDQVALYSFATAAVVRKDSRSFALANWRRRWWWGTRRRAGPPTSRRSSTSPR